MTSTYRRTVENADSNEVEVELRRPLAGEPVRLQVGGTFGARAHMTIAKVLELREVLDEVVWLAQLAAGPHEHGWYADMDEARANCAACLAGTP
jgi:hypothetical protein